MIARSRVAVAEAIRTVPRNIIPGDATFRPLQRRS